MKLIDGLYGYEIAMLVLGIAMFIVLLIGLIARLRKEGNIAPLLPFFGLSIAMIGYPSVKSVSIADNLVTIEKSTDELLSSPTNTAARNSVSTAVDQIKGRPLSDPSRLAVVATAQYALGDESAAKQNLQKALAQSPALPQAISLEHKIATVDNVKNLTKEVEQNPQNTSAKQSLQTQLSEASKLQIASPTAITQIARGQAAVGNYSQAVVNANKAAAIAPKSDAVKLAESLKRSAIESKVAPK